MDEGMDVARNHNDDARQSSSREHGINPSLVDWITPMESGKGNFCQDKWH